MIRRAGFFLLLLALGLGLFGGVAQAHVLKTDGSIGATLHIEPDDNPSTGQSTSYVLSFTDDTGKFSLLRCNCMVTIQMAGTTVYSGALQVSDPTDSVDSYTFQKPAVYTMQFTGNPTTPGAFQPFSLNYLVRVTGSGADTTQPFPWLIWLGLAMVVGLIVLAAYAMDRSDTLSRKRS